MKNVLSWVILSLSLILPGCAAYYGPPEGKGVEGERVIKFSFLGGDSSARGYAWVPDGYGGSSGYSSGGGYFIEHNSYQAAQAACGGRPAVPRPGGWWRCQ